MHSKVTATECKLSHLIGTSKEVDWANSLRDSALQYIWKQGWYGDSESFLEDAQRLPTEAKWWIENRDRVSNKSHEAARRFLRLKYTVPAGADY